MYISCNSIFALSPLQSFLTGNDDRYVSNVLDVRYSVFESLIRSIEHRKLELHRKFPKTESLKVSAITFIYDSSSVLIPASLDIWIEVMI